MFKTNVCVTSGIVHKTHIKRTISKHMSNFQQKYRHDWIQMSQLGRFFLRIIFLDSQHADFAPQADSCEWHPCTLLTEKQEYARTIYTVDVHGFFAPKLDWNLTNLGRMCWTPENPTGRMPGRCFCHYFCRLPHFQIGFRNDLDRGLCAWQFKYSAWFAQIFWRATSQYQKKRLAKTSKTCLKLLQKLLLVPSLERTGYRKSYLAWRLIDVSQGYIAML